MLIFNNNWKTQYFIKNVYFCKTVFDLTLLVFKFVKKVEKISLPVLLLKKSLSVLFAPIFFIKNV